MKHYAPETYRCPAGAPRGEADADPVTTEIVRHSLYSAANQMKRALVRTAFSPVIYEVWDFAVAIYDREVRMLAQAPSLPAFMGTMNFCVAGAVAAVGGEDALEPGDIVLYNLPYGTGSHQQDMAFVMPVFLSGETLIGYTAIKAHLLDIGGKDPYCTDTVDVFQEGTTYPGVKLYARGELVEDMYRTFLANSRVPKMVAGDLNALGVGVRTGAAELVRVVERYGLESFMASVERMYDHGEAVVRSYFDKIPDGRYVGHGRMDNNGLDEVPVPFEITVEVAGSTVRVDYTKTPDSHPGPINTPLASTVSASRIAISMLAGGGEAPNEGHFRPIEVVTRPGSMFHPLPPAPCFLYLWPALQAIEVIYDAIAKALPDAVPACSGGDLCGIVWWGTREATGEPWADGSPHPVGQGGHVHGDGGTLMHICESATRFSPVEVWEARNPWLLDRVELIPDSCGPGTHRGGLGIEMFFHALEECYATPHVERTQTGPWGLEGGREGQPNRCVLAYPDGRRIAFGKKTRLHVPKGATFELHCGGGGGYGPPAARDAHAVRRDLREGYITEAHARANYAHAFAEGGVRPAAE